MSLVGTRPPTVDEWEQYELHHRSRMSTKPGMKVGLGTSSILSAACVKAVFEFMGISYTEEELYAHVLVMEQIMSTGGGWQKADVHKRLKDVFQDNPVDVWDCEII